MDHPDAVKRATDIVFDAYRRCYQEICAIIAGGSRFVTDWLGLVAVENHDIVQCDFAASVGHKHFEEFCPPHMEAQCRMLDTSVFHLDGPDAVRHLDALLEVGGLKAIHWVPGAGKPPANAWLSMLRKVQAAGKGLVISSPVEDVVDLGRYLSPRGPIIHVMDVFETREEASSLIQKVRVACRS